MRKLFLASLILALLGSRTSAQTPATVTGMVTDAGNNPATSGYVQFDVIPNVSSVQYFIAGVGVITTTTQCGINASGIVQNLALSGPCTVWGNDLISPANTQYRITFAPNGNITNVVNGECISGGSYSLNNPVFCPIIQITPQQAVIRANPFAVNILPIANNTGVIGSAVQQWGAVYASQFFLNGTPLSVSPFGLGTNNTWTGSNTFTSVTNLNGGGNFTGTFTGNPTFSGNIIASTIGPSISQRHAIPAVASDTIVLAVISQGLQNKNMGTGTVFSTNIIPTVAAGFTLGTTAFPFSGITIGNAASQNIFILPSGTVTGTRTWTLQDANDTFVGRATTDTLTNKTIGTGNTLQVNAFNSGTGASGTTFWRGDGTWATPTFTQAPAVSVYSQTNLSGDVSVSAATLTTVMSVSPTIPSSGCPCRVLIAWSVGWTYATSGDVNFYVTDGTINFAKAASKSTSGGTLVGGADSTHFSTATYANSATPTFTLKVQSEQTLTVKKLASLAGPDSYIQATVFTSN